MVMGDITRIDTVQQYCDLFEVEALHPLVSVVNCYEVQPIRHSKKLYNIYAVLLKDTDCGTMNYGRSLYDYEKGSMLFIAPGQVMGSDDDGSLHQPALHGDSQAGIQYHPYRLGWILTAAGEHGIVCQYCADANADRSHPLSGLLNMGTGSFASYPFGSPAGTGDLAVCSHGIF